MKKPVNINGDQAERVCQVGQGAACCKYLGRHPTSAHWVCLKGSDLQPSIDKKKKMNAQSDNCSGPPDFNPQ